MSEPVTASTSVLPASRNNRHRIVTLVIFGAVAFLIATLYYGVTAVNVAKIPSALIGKPGGNFQATWIQGQQHLPQQAQAKGFSLADFRGKPVVLNFWASWCVSCREEALEFEKFWQAAKGRDVVVVGIAIQDTVEAAQKFALQYGKTYILGLDEDGVAAIDYGVSGVPETFIIDRAGIIVHKEVGPITAPKLEELIATLKL